MHDKLINLTKGIQQSNIRAVTKRIEAVGGINLGQGNCNLPPHPQIISAAQKALRDGYNSYTPYNGIMTLREAIVERYAAYNGLHISIDNVLVTCGATGAFETVCKCFLEPGDEVILFEPIYQYHVKLIKERGAIPRYVQLSLPDWSFMVEDLKSAFSEKTKFLALCNPNNPCGKVFSLEELTTIGNICKANGVFVVTDEVYEYILGDKATHTSLASLPGMFENTLTTSSASKTFFVTGWRVGWLIGPQEILEPLGVRSDETYICAPAPLQHAVCHGLRLGDDFFNNIRIPFQEKLSQLARALREAGLRPYDPAGAYYILCNYQDLPFADDESAMLGLIEKFGVAAVPGNAFFPSKANTGLVRFCFAVTDDLLNQACQRLTSHVATFIK